FDVEEGHDFADPIELKMHIVVDILDEEYDHHYTARFLFDEDSLEEVNASLAKLDLDIEEEKSSESPVDNSEVSGAGVNSGTLIVIILLVGIAAVLLYSFVFKKRKYVKWKRIKPYKDHER